MKSTIINTATEASVRADLAAAYRLCHKLGLNEGVCNHLTAMLPGMCDRFLVIRYGLMWNEVTADNLVLVDSTGKIVAGEGPVETTAFEIHRAIHLKDPSKYAAVFHTHQPWATALCCIKPREDQPWGNGLAMVHQNSCRFHDDISFDDTFNGLVHDSEEGNRLAAAFQGKRVLLHRNHGVIVCGRTVAEAFDDLYYLERAAQAQVLALSTGARLSLISDDIVRGTKAAFDVDKAAFARVHLDAWMRDEQREIERQRGSSPLWWRVVALGVGLAIGVGLLLPLMRKR